MYRASLYRHRLQSRSGSKRRSRRRLIAESHYAADGDAANTGATSGSKWRVHFAPDEIGTWTYVASFRTGANVAADDSPLAGVSAGFFDAVSGQITIAVSDKTGDDNRAKGRLDYVGERYLQYAETGEYFIKQGPDAPENLLAYADFDGPFTSDGQKDNLIKDYAPHVADWTAGDPTWGNDKGKGLIGAINYLASEDLNAFSFLTMNIGGDDRNVFPYTDYNERLRMDVSRLDQWEIVFEHGDALGMFLHFKTQETENDQLLDGGDLGVERKLYYRELVARFSHHLALNWNLGEENTNTTEQVQDFATYFREIDPYDHHVVLHTYPGQKSSVYTPLLGNASELTGVSLQTSNSNFNEVFSDTLTWVTQSEATGKPWVVAVDEPGNANDGLVPDGDPIAATNQTNARKNALWGTLMAGGMGNEWYFGYAHDHSDLTLSDFRSRDQFWDVARYAKEFFTNTGMPFWQMNNDNAVSSETNDYAMSKPGEAYAVYLKDGGTTNLDLSGQTGTYDVEWFDPRNGGMLQFGSVSQVVGGGSVTLGQPPNNASEDWAILVTRIGLPTASITSRAVIYGGTAADNIYGPGAIDTSKTALRSGLATRDNYTNYTAGLNRVVIDIENRPTSTLTAGDFEFRVGNTANPNGWTPLTTSTSIPLPEISVATGPGTNTDRVTLEWPDQAIKNTWLQVRVRATANTGLAEDDVFYFGNQVADVTGTTTAGQNVTVNATDVILTRFNQSLDPNDADITNGYDITKDGLVNAVDVILARFNQVLSGGLLMITAP